MGEPAGIAVVVLLHRKGCNRKTDGWTGRDICTNDVCNHCIPIVNQLGLASVKLLAYKRFSVGDEPAATLLMLVATLRQQ